MERKKRSKGRGWESCYVKKIYGTFGVEMRAYGQKLVKFCTHTHTRLSYSSIDASAAWDPHSQNNIKTLERIQRQAARFCKNNYSREPGSVTKLLQELGWETLKTRRKAKGITTLYKMEHNIIDIPLDQHIKHNTRCSRKHNSQFLQIRHSPNTFGHRFFPPTAKEWNALPSNIISSKSVESFQKNLNK